MSFWNYIGGYFLFRWLFGSRNRHYNINSSHLVDTTGYTPWHADFEDYDLDDDSRIMDHPASRHSHRQPYQGADIYDDEDDALDDYDPTDSANYSSDDFLDEQDDYDMMDDDF